MTVVIRYTNAYFNLKNQDLWSNAFVETKTDEPVLFLIEALLLKSTCVTPDYGSSAHLCPDDC